MNLAYFVNSGLLYEKLIFFEERTIIVMNLSVARFQSLLLTILFLIFFLMKRNFQTTVSYFFKLKKTRTPYILPIHYIEYIRSLKALIISCLFSAQQVQI